MAKMVNFRSVRRERRKVWLPGIRSSFGFGPSLLGYYERREAHVPGALRMSNPCPLHTSKGSRSTPRARSVDNEAGARVCITETVPVEGHLSAALPLPFNRSPPPGDVAREPRRHRGRVFRPKLLQGARAWPSGRSAASRRGSGMQSPQ